MPNNGTENIETLTHWMDKLFPVDTQLIDNEGMKYLVTGWYILHDKVHVKITHIAGNLVIETDVPFDKAMNWARFPPEHNLMAYSETIKKDRSFYL